MARNMVLVGMVLVRTDPVDMALAVLVLVLVEEILVLAAV
jgi:hypothetical protein